MNTHVLLTIKSQEWSPICHNTLIALDHKEDMAFKIAIKEGWAILFVYYVEGYQNSWIFDSVNHQNCLPNCLMQNIDIMNQNCLPILPNVHHIIQSLRLYFILKIYTMCASFPSLHPIVCRLWVVNDLCTSSRFCCVEPIYHGDSNLYKKFDIKPYKSQMFYWKK